MILLLDSDGFVFHLSESTSPCALHNVATWLGIRDYSAQIAKEEDLATAIDLAYEAAGSTTKAVEDANAGHPTEVSVEKAIRETERDLLATSGKAPVVKLVDALLFAAVQKGASDLHIQPQPDHISVRHRIDGVLDSGLTLPITLLRPLVSRVKILSGMDVAEQLIPQDGRTTVRIGDRSCDIRASSLPTPHGERIVLRILDTSRQLQRFSDLGMPEAFAGPYLAAARRSSGIILVTGPTGSGKTTTLYSTLRELDSRDRNIMTIEDPIEYELDALGLPISQSQVNTRKGVTFANGLRHILRQDPDVILVGEIRDAETAKVAIQASLTGHLVFSTLHTNDAPSAITRLIDLGVEPYLVSASLTMVIAQRLIRMTCPTCKGDQVAIPSCPSCGGSGLKGRKGIFELILLDTELRDAITKGASLQEITRLCRSKGMPSLRDSGMALVDQAMTTAEEVERVIHG